jgi:hypothetical protein
MVTGDNALTALAVARTCGDGIFTYSLRPSLLIDRGMGGDLVFQAVDDKDEADARAIQVRLILSKETVDNDRYMILRRWNLHVLAAAVAADRPGGAGGGPDLQGRG